jgi:hypothetical protein
MDESIATLTREDGVWVVHTGEPLSSHVVEAVFREIREERDLANLGWLLAARFLPQVPAHDACEGTDDKLSRYGQ